MNVELMSEFLLWAMAFIFSATCHEAAHALVAKLGGDPTAYYGGQVTLDPTPHIKRSPFGMVVVPLISFFMFGWMIGWASAPYDPRWARRYPHRAALMSLAGPAANFVLLLLCLIVLRIGLSTDLFIRDDQSLFLTGQGTAWATIARLFSIAFTLNLILGVFNLIPLPPLDGAQGILIFFKERHADVIQEKLQLLGMFGLIIAWLIFNRIAGPVIVGGWFLVYW